MKQIRMIFYLRLMSSLPFTHRFYFEILNEQLYTRVSSIPGPKRARIYFARRRSIHQPAELCLAEVRNQLKERGVDELRSQKRSRIRMVEDQTTQEKLARFVWLTSKRIR